MSAVLHRLGFSRLKARPYQTKKDGAPRPLLRGGPCGLAERGCWGQSGKKSGRSSKTKRGSDKKGASVTAGIPKASARPDAAINAIPTLISFAYIFAAAESGTDNAFVFISPEVATESMQVYLNEVAKTIAYR